MATITVVGSGASGVHFAWSLLERGHRVVMVDVGYGGEPAPLPDARVSGLKERLEDPAGYFLGADFEAVILPDADEEYYGLPPSKGFVLREPGGVGASARGFAPLFSFARGGLAEAWTGGCYPFDDEDLAEFPFGLAELEAGYEVIARRIGVTGHDDDLARFFPLHGGLMPPLELDEASRSLVRAYRRKRSSLNAAGFYLGRTRVAALSRDLDGRKACDYLGRCLWGCPTGAFYTPALTLARCRSHPEFTYVPGLRVTSFGVAADGRVDRVRAVAVKDGSETELAVDVLALAAGTLCSSAIFLRSVLERDGDCPRLPGLMDNPQVLVPFVQLRMLGRVFREDTYQYHLLGLGIDAPEAGGYVHGQITTLKTGMIHPVAQSLPCDLRAALALTRNLRAALGMVNLNFADTRRPQNYLTLLTAGENPLLRIEYGAKPLAAAEIRRATGRAVRALRRLGCVVPPGMIHQRPMGASVHYAGTLPMTREPAPWTTDEVCRSRDFANLYLLDGATFPALPAKNITFTLMANAVRVARAVF